MTDSGKLVNSFGRFPPPEALPKVYLSLKPFCCCKQSSHCYGIALEAEEDVRSRYGKDIKGFHMSLKACAYREKGMMLSRRGLAMRSVRPWRVWNKYKSLSSTSE